MTVYGQTIRKQAGSATTTIGTNIQNPHWFSWYNLTVSGTSYGCCPNTTPYYNSWSARNNAIQSGNTSTDNIVVKTIYNPCPVGYTVAPANAFSGMTTNGWVENDKGHVQQGCWFPAAGIRGLSDGNINNTGANGFCWQTEPGGYLTFNNSSATPLSTGGFLSTGLTIRPVSEDYK